MFGFFSKHKNKRSVDALLLEGRSWTDRLESAAIATQEDADALVEEAQALMFQATSTQFVADEGMLVANEFKKILYPSTEE